MNVILRPLIEEKDVMINQLLSPIKVHENCMILIRLAVINKVRRLEIEMRSIKIKTLVEIRDTNSEMSQLVDWSGTGLETLRFIDGSVFGSWKIILELLRDLGGCLNGSLTEDKMQWELAPRVGESHSFPTTWSIRIMNWCSPWELSRQLEIL